jgi:hypothetical protein
VGPGYPILLAPFVLLKAPWVVIKLLNAVFLFGAMVYFYHAIRFYAPGKYLPHLSYLFGLYPPFLRFLGHMITETLAVFLISGMTPHFCKLVRDRRQVKVHAALAGLFLG